MKRHARPHGRYTVGEVDVATGVNTPLFSRDNAILLDWIRMGVQCLMLGDVRYKINAMYLEFENTAGSASAPSFDLEDGVDYYLGLTGARDYLRLPLTSLPALTVNDAARFEGTGVDFDAATFTTQSSGTSGAGGLSFSSGSNSLVFGIALVAAPIWADRTRDLIFARAYFDVSEQQRKTATKQVSIAWMQALTLDP